AFMKIINWPSADANFERAARSQGYRPAGRPPKPPPQGTVYLIRSWASGPADGATGELSKLSPPPGRRLAATAFPTDLTKRLCSLFVRDAFATSRPSALRRPSGRPP